jgi:hypothetical protein
VKKNKKIHTNVNIVLMPSGILGKCLQNRMQGTSQDNSVYIKDEQPKQRPARPVSLKEQQ